MLMGLRVHCTLFRRLAQIHYGQTKASFSPLLRSPTPRFAYPDVPSVIRSLFSQHQDPVKVKVQRTCVGELIRNTNPTESSASHLERCFVAGTLCPGSHRQSEPETTALTHLTLDPHLATVSLDQVPGDGQPQARAAS
jgi:hypothetical protein